jgi:hypothetical protein
MVWFFCQSRSGLITFAILEQTRSVDSGKRVFGKVLDEYVLPCSPCSPRSHDVVLQSWSCRRTTASVAAVSHCVDTRVAQCRKRIRVPGVFVCFSRIRKRQMPMRLCVLFMRILHAFGRDRNQCLELCTGIGSPMISERINFHTLSIFEHGSVVFVKFGLRVCISEAVRCPGLRDFRRGVED